MPKISVIVPVYNTSKYLSKCIDSLINQTFDDYEIIFINDGSTDNSANVIKKYKNSKIKLINKKNEGQALARNLGIKKAKGDYIMFVDSDDYIDKDTLKITYKKALETKADIVCFDNYLVINDKITDNIIKKIEGEDNLKTFILNNSGPCFKLIKKEIIQRNNLYFPSLNAYEDIAIVPSYSLFANKIVAINDKLYYYVMRDGSTMKQLEYSSKLEDIFPSMDNLLKIFKNNNADEKYYDELEYLFIEHLLHGAGLRFFEFQKYEQISKINKIMKQEFPNWKTNIYLKKLSFKYRIMCLLLFNENFWLIKLLKR